MMRASFVSSEVRGMCRRARWSWRCRWRGKALALCQTQRVRRWHCKSGLAERDKEGKCIHRGLLFTKNRTPALSGAHGGYTRTNTRTYGYAHLPNCTNYITHNMSKWRAVHRNRKPHRPKRVRALAEQTSRATWPGRELTARTRQRNTMDRGGGRRGVEIRDSARQ